MSNAGLQEDVDTFDRFRRRRQPRRRVVAAVSLRHAREIGDHAAACAAPTACS
jgi:hypothetical protein